MQTKATIPTQSSNPNKLKKLSKIKLTRSVENLIPVPTTILHSNSNKNDNFFVGSNTDGEGALEPLKGFFQRKESKKIALLGLGGAGKAIAAYLCKKKNSQDKLYFF